MFKVTNNGTCWSYPFILIPTINLRPFSKDRVKIIGNNETLVEVTSVTSTVDHFIFDPTDEITIDFESDSALFGIYPYPSILFEYLALRDTKRRIINLSENLITFTLDLSEKERALEFITVRAPVEYTLDVFLTQSLYDSVWLQNSYLYDSNSTKNMIAR